MSGTRPKIRQAASTLRFYLKAVDSLSIVLGLMLLIVWVPEVNSRSTIVIGLVAIGLFGMVAELLGLYRNWRGIPFEREATCAMLSWLGTMFALAALGQFALYSTEIRGHALWLWFLFNIILGLGFRIVYRSVIIWMIHRGIRTRDFAVIGCNDLGKQLVSSLESSPDLGLRFSGFYDDRTDDRLLEMHDDLPRLGDLDTLLEKTHTGEVQVVFITIAMRGEERIRNIIRAERYDRIGLYRPRFIRVPTVAFTLDGNSRSAGC